MESDTTDALEAGLSTLVNAMARDSRIVGALLLGSIAAGTARPDSDIDIGIVPEPGTDLRLGELLEMAAPAALLAGRSVDPGIIDTHNLVYAFQAFATGKPLFVRDAGRFNMLRATLLGMYADFQTERAEVLDAYRA